MSPASAPTDHDFELWMIEGNNPPVSMGVIPVGATTHIADRAAKRRRSSTPAPCSPSASSRKGGSPTGQPTGPVVAAGDLQEHLSQ